MLDSQLVKEGEALTNWTSGVLASRRPGIPSRIQIADGATVPANRTTPKKVGGSPTV